VDVVLLQKASHHLDAFVMMKIAIGLKLLSADPLVSQNNLHHLQEPGVRCFVEHDLKLIHHGGMPIGIGKRSSVIS